MLSNFQLQYMLFFLFFLCFCTHTNSVRNETGHGTYQFMGRSKDFEDSREVRVERSALGEESKRSYMMAQLLYCTVSKYY